MSPTKASADEATTDEPNPGETSEEDKPDDGLTDEERLARDELDVKRLAVALVMLDDESLRRGLAGVTEKQRQELATSLNLPRATVHLGDALAPLVRRKLRGLSIDRQHAVSTALTQRANDSTVEALGDRSEDPSRADLDEVLPAVIEEHGLELVRLMVASYAISDAVCRDVMRELLDSDERFALPDELPDEVSGTDELPSFGLVARAARQGRRAGSAACRAPRTAQGGEGRTARGGAARARREGRRAGEPP